MDTSTQIQAHFHIHLQLIFRHFVADKLYISYSVFTNCLKSLKTPHGFLLTIFAVKTAKFYMAFKILF